MNKSLTLLIVCAAASLTACAPAHISQLRKSTGSGNSEVLVYREYAFNAGGASLIFGIDKNDLVELYGDRYSILRLPVGEHTFFARSNGGDQPFSLQLQVKANERTCIKAFPNPANFAKSLMPISHLFGNSFLLERSACPTKEELAKFEQVLVTYKED